MMVFNVHISIIYTLNMYMYLSLRIEPEKLTTGHAGH